MESRWQGSQEALDRGGAGVTSQMHMITQDREEEQARGERIEVKAHQASSQSCGSQVGHGVRSEARAAPGPLG